MIPDPGLIAAGHSAGNNDALAPHLRRVADAHRAHHEAQVGLSFGEPISLATDEAAEAYRDAVADAHAANAARRQELVAGLRLLAEDATGDRDAAGGWLCRILGILPADTLAVLVSHAAAIRDLRRENAALWVELRDALTRLGAVERRLSALERKPAGSAVPA